MGVLVEPKIGSYILEWEAIRFLGSEYAKLKKIFHHTPWVVSLNLTDEGAQAVCTNTSTSGQLEQWTVKEGDWVVKSPHGKVWVMDEEDFHSQFNIWNG